MSKLSLKLLALGMTLWTPVASTGATISEPGAWHRHTEFLASDQPDRDFRVVSSADVTFCESAEYVLRKETAFKKMKSFRANPLSGDCDVTTVDDADNLRSEMTCKQAGKPDSVFKARASRHLWLQDAAISGEFFGARFAKIIERSEFVGPCTGQPEPPSDWMDEASSDTPDASPGSSAADAGKIQLAPSEAVVGDRNPLICDEPRSNGHFGNDRVATLSFYQDKGVWHHFSEQGSCDPATCLGADKGDGNVSSSNPSVARVDSFGAIQPVGLGIATIAARGSDSPVFVYVEVTRIDSARIDFDRLRGFDFIDWTRHAEIKSGKVLEDPLWTSTQLTITNLGDIPLRSDDTVLRIEGLPKYVEAIQICPGALRFSKQGEVSLIFRKEFLLPGESQDFSVVFANGAKKTISFTPKVLRANAVVGKPELR